MPEIVYSEAHRGDEDAIDAFHRFGDPALFVHECWTYRPDQSVFAVGRDGDRIVGTEALMAYELSVCGKRMLTGRSERTLVDPGYRGKDIWQNLMALCADRGRARGMAFAWGATNAQKAFEKVGFSFHTGHRSLMYSLASVRGLIGYLAALAARGAFSPRHVRAQIAGGRTRDLEQYIILAAAVPSLLLRAVCALPMRVGRGRYEITTEPRAWADHDDLYQRLGVVERDIYLPQDAAFVDWTLAGANIRCKRYYAYEQGRLAGYVYATADDPWVATIIDFAFADRRAQAALLRQLRADPELRRRAFFKVSVYMRNPVQQGYVAAFVAAGFVRLYRGGKHVVMPLLCEDRAVLEDMSRWYLTDLWYAMYRRKGT